MIIGIASLCEPWRRPPMAGAIDVFVMREYVSKDLVVIAANPGVPSHPCTASPTTEPDISDRNGLERLNTYGLCPCGRMQCTSRRSFERRRCSTPRQPSKYYQEDTMKSVAQALPASVPNRRGMNDSLRLAMCLASSNGSRRYWHCKFTAQKCA